ncbi:MAG: hydrogen gas-evolving membrane-bound hydrogenase subunit E [Fidelibacterota bacterium]
MPVETWLIFILGFMIIGSIIALELKDLLSAVISIGIVGLGVSIAFLLLQALDLAIVQFLFEIFALIILIRAFNGKEYHIQEPSRGHIVQVVVTVFALSLILVLSIHVFRAIPAFGEPIFSTAKHYVENAGQETGSANIVTAIILDYRAYDTLGEVTVLFTAILGALAILRTKKSDGATGGDNETA